MLSNANVKGNTNSNMAYNKTNGACYEQGLYSIINSQYQFGTSICIKIVASYNMNHIKLTIIRGGSALPR